MKVRIKSSYKNYRVGRIYDVDAEEAVEMCQCGSAVPLRAAPTVEQAVVTPHTTNEDRESDNDES